MPFENSVAYARERPHVDLVAVDDDHRLVASLPTIEEAALRWLRHSEYHWDFFGPERVPTAARRPNWISLYRKSSGSLTAFAAFSASTKR